VVKYYAGHRGCQALTRSASCLAAFPLEGMRGEGSRGAVHPGSFCKRGAKRPCCRQRNPGCADQNEPAGVTPRGHSGSSAFLGGPRFAVLARRPREAPPREPRQSGLCHGGNRRG
jgi:hypothetical protein